MMRALLVLGVRLAFLALWSPLVVRAWQAHGPGSAIALALLGLVLALALLHHDNAE